jgi:acetylornithine/succinyldiaminopimelate/putrescine aminotransferase
MINEQIPNLFRPWINPHVAQACYCLTHLVAEAWPGALPADQLQVFLANSGEEALSGAIKLARYAANAEGLLATGLIVDEEGRFEHFAQTDLGQTGQVTFIPGLTVLADRKSAAEFLADSNKSVGFVVVSHEWLLSAGDFLATHVRPGTTVRRPLLIAYTTIEDLARRDQSGPCTPDIVVFDESFVNRDVPFGAFVASKQVFQWWNRRGMSTFHSTTYQPNTISTMHLVSCLRASVPDFIARHESALQRIVSDPQFRVQTFRDTYSKSLVKVAAAIGAGSAPAHAAGNYVDIAGKRIFDGVAGVACSVRGHNPPTYVADIRETGDLDDCRAELGERLTALTGLPRMVPAVSGASAVEHALKLALASQYPRDWVLALRGGFGGKTLFALTGTWKSTLKAGLSPLYPNVVYVDPFAADAVAQVEAAFRNHPIGVAQLELIQGVGGVRPIPPTVLQCLADMRKKNDCLLLVDEVQTGMFRTGPFVRSRDVNVQPDLLTFGKSTSDMMFPFALTMYSAEIQRRLDERDCRLAEALWSRYGFETGLRTLLHTLRQAETNHLADQVRSRGELFRSLLESELRGCRLVRDLRCFGLLIGIDLDADRAPHRWLKKLVGQLYLLAMLNHRQFPLLVGYCQYEPNVLKLTPPLGVTPDEVRSICKTISAALHQSLPRVALAGLWQMTAPSFIRSHARPRSLA